MSAIDHAEMARQLQRASQLLADAAAWAKAGKTEIALQVVGCAMDRVQSAGLTVRDARNAAARERTTA